MRRRKTKRIPDDIHIEILKFLPSKSLMCFRCVSKSWNLTILDPTFAKIHKTISQTRPTATILLSFNQHDQKIYFYKINSEREAIHQLTIDITKFGFSYCTRIADIVNGLVCFSSYRDVTVCNTATHEIISLPPQPNNIPDTIYALGYDPLNHEYKVLCIWWYHHEYCKCKVFTIGKSKEWRDVIDPLDCQLIPNERRSGMYRDVVYNDGVLHWLTKKPYHGQNHGLVMFDVREEKFRVIHVPFDQSTRLSIIRIAGRVVVHDNYSGSCLEDVENQVWSERNICFQRWSGCLIGSVANKLIYAHKFRQREVGVDPNANISRILESFHPISGVHSKPVVRGRNVVKESIGTVERPAEYFMCEIVEDIYPLMQNQN